MLHTYPITAKPAPGAPSVETLLADIDGAAARQALRDIKAEEIEEKEDDEETEALPWWCAPAKVR